MVEVVRRRPAPAVRLALLAVLALAVAATVLVLGHGTKDRGGVALVPTPPRDGHFASVADPFAWDPARADEFVRLATRGTSHALYTRSPGGVLLTAARTARYRPLVDKAARQANVDPNLLEGLVFLESAGRPDAMTSGGTEGAVGLTQILAETAQNLLGMGVDVTASSRYTRRIARERRRGRLARVQRLEAARRRADPRFDPASALSATARYLVFARGRLGREDLAFAAYHMGVGNLEGVLRLYAGKPGSGPVAGLVKREKLTYPQVYFDSTPARHAAAYRRLYGFGDDSSNYLWKLHAAAEIMRLYRHDPARLFVLANLQTAKNSAEEVLHPHAETPTFANPAALRRAWDARQIIAFPQREAVTGLRRDGSMGELAERLDVPRGLYRGLRPEALAMALYIGAQTRALSGTSPLFVTSTVRDQAYQRLLIHRNSEATQNYSLHTTGWAFDVSRAYRSRAQALAFQFVLDRLQVLDAIAWVREPDAIHVTVSKDAKPLLGLLDRIGERP
jgi:soluble lytic murein transglycosylase-like protein